MKKISHFYNSFRSPLNFSLLFVCILVEGPIQAKETQRLILDTMTESERIKTIKSFFTPPIGSDVQIDHLSKNDYWTAFSASKAKGFIGVDPPKGACFTITMSNLRGDERVCWDKPKQLSFYLRELNGRGEVRWLIRTGPKDQGYEYSWTTPNRLAQVLRSRPRQIDPKTLTHLSSKVDLISCSYKDETRTITLKPIEGDDWHFSLAVEDVKPTILIEPPNLHLEKEKGLGGLSKDAESSFSGSEIPIRSSKPGDPVTTHWVISMSGTYSVSSDHFTIGDQTDGTKGECRYRLPKNLKAGGREDGEVECHNTLDFEVVYFRLACGPLETNY